MSSTEKNFPFADCLVSTAELPVSRVFPKADRRPDILYLLFDLSRFGVKLRELGEEKVVSLYLSDLELKDWQRLTSNKRRREWLGGRFGAKYAAAEILTRRGHPVVWSDLAVLYDNSGRPYLAGADDKLSLPDVSISHSGGLAAVMAVSRGLCGIDVQKTDEKAVKVRDRFCTDREERILAAFFSAAAMDRAVLLTLLWSAKEALRKVEKCTIPGFLELELARIQEISGPGGRVFWKFILARTCRDQHDNYPGRKYAVGLGLVAEYILAVTIFIDREA